MRVTVVTAPADEPLGLDEVKTMLRVDSDEENTRVFGLIQSARSFFENETGYALINRTLDASLRFWPKATNVLLPYPPLVSVTSVKYYPLGVETTWASNNYHVDNDARQGSILLIPGGSWPSGVLYPPGVVVRYVAGFGDEGVHVPEDIRQCLRAIISFWDDMPEAVYAPGDTKASGNVDLLPLHAKDVIERYRKERER